MKNDLLLALQAMREAYPTIQEIKDPATVVAFMGLLFDQYCADHKIEQEEKSNLLMAFVDASNYVNYALGALPTTVKKEAE